MSATTPAQTMNFDVIVIGWGKGGKTLAATLSKSGKKVAIIEESQGMYGGTCINIGCVPTKFLVHRAEERPSSKGIAEDGEAAIQWFKDSVAGRDGLIGKLNAANYAMLDAAQNVTIVDGHARFTGPHTVEVQAGSDLLKLTAPTIVINTGATHIDPPATIEGADASRFVYDSTTIQHVDPLPKHLVIVGGSFIALEFASMFAHYGSQVTVLVRRPMPLPQEDPDTVETLIDILTQAGVRFITGTNALRLEDRSDHTLVHLDNGDTLVAQAVLFALGRRAQTDDLGLENAGIETTERGFIRVDEYLRTNVEGVYAIGDVNGGPQFTYISLDDYRIVVDQLLGQGKRSTKDRKAVPSTAFITPPFAWVGMSEGEALKAGHKVEIAKKDVAQIASMPKAKIYGQTQGMMKFIIDANTDEILGARLISIDAQELINTVALAMRTGVTATQLRDSIFTHPSSTEAFNEVLGVRQG